VRSKSPNGAGINQPGVKPRKRKREKQEPQRGGINQPGVKPRERKREKQEPQRGGDKSARGEAPGMKTREVRAPAGRG